MTLLAFTLLAFERADLSASPVPWYELSIIPFGLAILRYALLLDKGAGGAPEEVVLRDRTLQVLGLSFAVLAAIGVYTA
jgi:decaprenyl-phosphate phosphoribosyltransferase